MPLNHRVLLLGVHSSDSIGFRDERAGVGGYESKSQRTERKKAGEDMLLLLLLRVDVAGGKL